IAINVRIKIDTETPELCDSASTIPAYRDALYGCLFTDFNIVSSIRLARFFLNLDSETVRSVDAPSALIS
ncbi:MAG: hypothetical protein WCB69_10380, partial [Pseudolabrys sp.]